MLFTFERVTLTRGSTTILAAVDVSIPDAGVTAIVGPSGAGKSTLLRCGNRLERPTSGRVLFRGTDVQALDPQTHRRRVAMVFQAPTAFPGTGLDNLRVAAPGLSEIDARRLLGRVGLPADVLPRQADTLSGGEAQRLCLARALATEPAAILADEPTASLDAEAASVLESLARQLAADGIPIVWVTHQLAQLPRLADHVVELRDGAVTFAGPIAAHRARPEEPTDGR